MNDCCHKEAAKEPCHETGNKPDYLLAMTEH